MPCIPTPHYPCEAVTGVAEDVKIYNAPQDITGTLKADNNNNIFVLIERGFNYANDSMLYLCKQYAG